MQYINILNIIIAQYRYSYIKIFLKNIYKFPLLFNNEIIILSLIVSKITIKKTC